MKFKDYILQDWRNLYECEPSFKRVLCSFLWDQRFAVVFIYRIECYLYKKNKKRLARLLHRINMLMHSCDLSPKAEIGEGLYFPHPFGIVIGHGVKAGKNLTLFQGVTLGSKDLGKPSLDNYPKIGNNVTFYPHSIAYGSIEIFDNSKILPNSVVITNIRESSLVGGIPAKEIGKI